MRSFVVCEHDPSLRIAKHFFRSGFNALSEFCRRCQYRRMKSIPLERWQMACAVALLACASAGAQDGIHFDGRESNRDRGRTRGEIEHLRKEASRWRAEFLRL